MSKLPWQKPVDHYKDVYGRIWQRVDELNVWNIDIGYGGWFNGKGLFKL